MDQADGILFTEYMVQTDENTVRNIQHPKILVENNVRVAHVYNNTFQQVRQNFTIAGLLTSISVNYSQLNDLFFFYLTFVYNFRTFPVSMVSIFSTS